MEPILNIYSMDHIHNYFGIKAQITIGWLTILASYVNEVIATICTHLLVSTASCYALGCYLVRVTIDASIHMLGACSLIDTPIFLAVSSHKQGVLKNQCLPAV